MMMIARSSADREGIHIATFSLTLIYIAEESYLFKRMQDALHISRIACKLNRHTRTGHQRKIPYHLIKSQEPELAHGLGIAMFS